MQIFKKLIAASLVLVCGSSFAAYKLPKYETYQMKNGLTVYLMQQDEVPLIDVNVVIKAGSSLDGDKAGLNYFTAKNIALGTKKLNKKALDDTLDFIGADVSASSNVEFSTLSASFTTKDQTLVFNTMKDILLNPRFDSEEFSKFKKRHLLSLEQAKESPKSVVNTYFNQLVFEKGGYASVVRGDKNSVQALTLNDIKKHHETWYQPNNAAIIVVGDFNNTQIKQTLKNIFSGWKRNDVPKKVKIAATQAPNKAKVLLVNKETAKESTFLIGGKGIAKANEDRVGLSVINTILGGRFTSWLNDELRVNAGLTYGARSRFSTYGSDGTFVISTFTKTETTVEAIDLALKTYSRLWQTGIDEETLSSAKAYVKGQFPPKFETSEQLAALLADMYGYQYDEKYINSFEQQVDSLTVKKASELINKYFPKDNLQFVVVGKASEIKNKVAKYGDVTAVDIKDIGFNIQ